MPAFLQAFSRPAFQASACRPRVRHVSIRLMQSDGAILTTEGIFQKRFYDAKKKDYILKDSSLTYTLSLTTKLIPKDSIMKSSIDQFQ
jgi:phosphatidylserine decarboxylase